MRNSRNKSKCTKQQIDKCIGVCRTYSDLQTAYALRLAQEESISEFRCNVPLVDFPEKEGAYTTDFLLTKADGEIAVRECIMRDLISKPKQARLLDASRVYWLKRGVTDWGIVINVEK